MRKSGISAQAAAAQILGWGAAGKKLAESRKVGKWESGKVGKSRNTLVNSELLNCLKCFAECRLVPAEQR